MLASASFLWMGTGLAGAAEPATDTTTAAAAADDEGGGWYLWGNALQSYRFRDSGGDEMDNDIWLQLDAGGIDPSDHWQADLSLALWADVDGTAKEGEQTAVASQFDAFEPVFFDVYTLSAEYHARHGLSLARLGRQTAPHGLPVVFDGATVEYSLGDPKLSFFAFGGSPHFFFELDSKDDPILEDWMAAAGAVYQPLRSLRIEAEYRFVSEQIATVVDESAGKESYEDHGYGLRLWFRPGEWLQANAYLRGIEEGIAHVGGGLTAEIPSLHLGLTGHVAAQPIELDRINETENAYLAILGRSLPYVKAMVEAWKKFDSRAGDFGLHLGWNSRTVLSEETGPFNRDHGRIYLRLDADDIGFRGPFVSATAELHYFPGSGLDKAGLYQLGGAAGWSTRALRAEVGTYFQQFKYSYYRDVEEIVDVRTVYGAVRVRPLDWLTVRARYDFEHFDRNVHTFSLMLGQAY